MPWDRRHVGYCRDSDYIKLPQIADSSLLTIATMANIALIIPLVVVSLILAVLLCIGAWVFNLIPENCKDCLKRIIGYTPSPPPDDLELHHCPHSCHTPPTPSPRTQQVIQYPQSHRISRSLQVSMHAPRASTTKLARVPTISTLDPDNPHMYPPKYVSTFSCNNISSPVQSCRLSTTSFDSAGSSYNDAYTSWRDILEDDLFTHCP